ncbi:MAG: hypothetical protein H0W83_03340 [Planctomycetes bacterium]|nr:hypothetical protein [Planctomycetota bacterium]
MLVVLVLTAVIITVRTAGHPTAHRDQVGAPGGPLRESTGSGPVDSEPALRALARAVAAAGQADDGDPSALEVLDREAAAELAPARRLLASSPMRSSPMRSATAPPPLTAGSDPGDIDRTAASGTSPGGRLDAGRAPDPRTALRDTPDGPTLNAGGVWSTTTFTPTSERHAWSIRNDSGHDYVISVEAGDFSTIRIDGGLVVPGRFYRIGATTAITSSVPCTVVIRPLEAVNRFHDRPMLSESGNG